MSSQFFVCDNHFIPIFSSLYEAKLAASRCYDQGVWIEYGEKFMQDMVSSLKLVGHNSEVFYSKIEEPIFVVEEIETFWHVIIGEKIGYISINAYTRENIKPLFPDKETQPRENII